MKEIGGYFELEIGYGKLYHDNAQCFNSGRSCFAVIVNSYCVDQIWLPLYMCDAIENKCKDLGVKISYYNVTTDLSPQIKGIPRTDWLYLVNYFGLNSDIIINTMAERENIIVDNAQAFFLKQMGKCPTLYSCRKFFGVPDGGYLYIDNKAKDYSSLYDAEMVGGRVGHLIGRYEGNAESFYDDYLYNEKCISDGPIRRMSKVSSNLLRGVDYKTVKEQREMNYRILHECLSKINLLNVGRVPGPYAYPLLIEEGERLRNKLCQMKIYIPTLWPNVLKNNSIGSSEYFLANNLLPLPCDQRYTEEDMVFISKMVLEQI